MKSVFCNWDGRPALVFHAVSRDMFALAMLKPGAPWVEVDADDVYLTSIGIETEEAFRGRFRRSFGDMDIPTEEKAGSFIPQSLGDRGAV